MQSNAKTALQANITPKYYKVLPPIQYNVT